MIFGKCNVWQNRLFIVLKDDIVDIFYLLSELFETENLDVSLYIVHNPTCIVLQCNLVITLIQTAAEIPWNRLSLVQPNNEGRVDQPNHRAPYPSRACSARCAGSRSTTPAHWASTNSHTATSASTSVMCVPRHSRGRITCK